MALYLRDIAPWGRGSTGRGVEHPPPLSPASLVERYSPTTPTARPLPRPPPAPSRGGRAVWDDSPGYSARGDERDLGGVFTLTAKGCLFLAVYLRDIAPGGRGSTGRGEAETSPPSPVSACHPKTSLARSPPGPRALTLDRPHPAGRFGPRAAPAPGSGSQTAPRLHSLQRVAPPVLPPRPGGPSRLADPLHVPVRLVRPGSRAVFSPVIPVTFPGDDRTPDPESPTITIIIGNSSGETPAPPRPPPSSGEADHPRSPGSRSVLQKTDTG